MTGPTADDPTAQSHLDADTLADLHAGLLGEAQRDTARAHVEACASCARRLADIEAVPALLAAASDEPMPDDVAARVAAAIRQEAAGAGVPGVPGDQLAARRAHRNRRWGSPGAGVAAAALAVLVGVGIALGVVLPGGDGAGSHPTAGSAAGDAAALTSTTITATGNAYTSDNLERLVPPLVTGTPAPRLPATRESAGSAPEAAPAPASAFLSEERTTASAPSPPSEPTGDAVDRLRQRLAACAQELEPAPGQRPLAVDIGTFDKQPAAVFVYAAPTGGGYYAYVVKATDACPGGVFTLWHRVKATG